MDFAFSKMLLVAAVALMVVGPKDLPRLARRAGSWMGRLMAMRDHWMRELRSASDPWEQAGRQAGQALSELGRIGAHGAGQGAAADPWAGLERANPKPRAPGIQAKARKAKALRAAWERRMRAGSGYRPTKIRKR